MTKMILEPFIETIVGNPNQVSSNPTGAGGGTGTNVLSMSLALTTAGRLGFYVDYSELATTGTHTFYVCRTHGTTGAVTVDYATSGDSHTSVSGTLSWATGEANIKSFTATVSSKSAGDHRMWALLSNPTGGSVLHNGATHTRAFGVIDDGTIASDSDAVFYDSAATGGTGTQADPYDSIYTAITNIGSKRYIYGKGSTVITATNQVSIAGSGTINCINAPATRANEAARAYIRNWPGFTWGISGTGTTTGGFFAEAGESYHTYRGIDFSGLDSSGATIANCFGVFYRYNNSSGINSELCTYDDINGATGANNGGFMPWGVDGFRSWRNTYNNIQTNGVNTNENTGGVTLFNGESGSMQRDKCTNMYHGLYHKNTVSPQVSTSVRFCIMKTLTQGVAYREAGAGQDGHQYPVTQNNLFSACDIGIYHWVTVGGGVSAEKLAWSNNVFDTCGGGTEAAIQFRAAFNSQIYNNIMLDCRRVWNDAQDAEATKSPDVEYADYNVEFGTTLTSQRYGWKGAAYSTAALLDTASGFAGNDVSADPVFTNTALDDYTLDTGSSATGAGVSSVDCGIYLTGIEVVGPA
tara:strand:+ start:29 stop:1771 length:1743 start_codon:yes stop_codon:yes gene_type:complete